MNQKPPVYIQNFWHANNYGAVITGYALYKIIEQKGYDTKLIDVSTTEDKRKYNFNKFINKYCKTTKHIQTYSDLEDIIDPTATYITGSDQIFRPDLAKDNLSNFLLDYLKTQRKIAFSASFGLSKDEFIENNSKEDVNHIKDSLQSFDFVSVREYDGVDICKNVFNVDAEHIIDPVFILDKTKYDEIIKTSKKNYQNMVAAMQELAASVAAESTTHTAKFDYHYFAGYGPKGIKGGYIETKEFDLVYDGISE